LPDEPNEAFYNLENDPAEEKNLIAEPELQDKIVWFRPRLLVTLEKHLPAQIGLGGVIRARGVTVSAFHPHPSPTPFK
jgi:hypothetical protein